MENPGLSAPWAGTWAMPLSSDEPWTAAFVAHNRCTMLLRIHHAAIICSDYEVSKRFYTQVLALPVLAEHWRAERRSWKLDLGLPDGSQIELFSFEHRPARPSYPEARGLRHLAFAVADVARAKADLEAQGVKVEAIRVDEYTGRRFTFFADPDDLPLELYETAAP